MNFNKLLHWVCFRLGFLRTLSAVPQPTNQRLLLMLVANRKQKPKNKGKREWTASHIQKTWNKFTTNIRKWTSRKTRQRGWSDVRFCDPAGLNNDFHRITGKSNICAVISLIFSISFHCSYKVQKIPVHTYYGDETFMRRYAWAVCFFVSQF